MVSSKASRQTAISGDLWMITLKRNYFIMFLHLLYTVLTWADLKAKAKCQDFFKHTPKVLHSIQKKKLRDVLFKLTWVLKTMWTPPGTTNAACSLRKSNTSWTVAENGRPLRRRQSLVFMPFMHGPGTKKGGWKGGCWGRGGNMIGGKLCKKLL